MCIIIAKMKHKRLPTESELRNSFFNNNDGAGLMYVDNGEVCIEKGFMTYKEFKKRYDELCKEYNNFEGKSLVLHFRIGTSSGNTPKNTHPYPITYKESDLHKTRLVTDLGVVHNGIIHDYNPKGKNPTTNDTQQFIMRYLHPLYSNFKDFYKCKAIMNGIDDITNSKFTFLDTEDKLYFVGDFINKDGLLFSNNTYMDYSSYYSNIKSSGYSAYNWEDYDALDTLSFNNSFNYEDDDFDEELIVLDPSWYVSYNNMVELVGDRMLEYNVYTGELYLIDFNNTSIKLSEGALVYDENCEEVIF
jgi:predicted glutamine amidotransferase